MTSSLTPSTTFVPSSYSLATLIFHTHSLFIGSSFHRVGNEIVKHLSEHVGIGPRSAELSNPSPNEDEYLRPNKRLVTSWTNSAKLISSNRGRADLRIQTEVVDHLLHSRYLVDNSSRSLLKNLFVLAEDFGLKLHLKPFSANCIGVSGFLIS